MEEKQIIKRFFHIFIFASYIAILLYFLFFAERLGRAVGATEYSYNLIPFKEIKRYIMRRKELGFASVFMNLAGNILAFIPFGYLVNQIFNQKIKMVLTIPIGLAFSLIIELIQLVSKVGSFDVDDLILNTLGVVIGVGIYVLISRLETRKNGKTQE